MAPLALKIAVGNICSKNLGLAARSLVLLAAALVSLSGCVEKEWNFDRRGIRSPLEGESSGSPWRAVFDPLSPKAKIFLVAASSQSANFPQEIIDQRRIWQAAGYGSDEIVCYYVVPFRDQFEEDIEQFRELEGDLADCYLASAAILRRHLRETARRSLPFVYLYLTGHGRKPAAVALRNLQKGDGEYWEVKREASYPPLNQYRIAIEAMADGSARDEEILGAYRAGVDPRDLYFTPLVLRELLAGFPAQAWKYVVLQGCFSGGFVENPEERTHPLAGLSKLVVLTAARFDRASFGCEAGVKTTNFGGAFNETLRRTLPAQGGDLRYLDWTKLYREMEQEIGRLERSEGDLEPSLPVFYRVP